MLYIIEQSAADDALAFWTARRSSYKLLAPLAEDLQTAPASQAFMERIFFSLWSADDRVAKLHLQILRNANFLEAE